MIGFIYLLLFFTGFIRLCQNGTDPLLLEVDENGEGCWITFDSYINLLKTEHDQGDSIVAIKSNNVKRRDN